MTDHDWDDERLEAAFASAFDRPAPAGLVDRTIAATGEPAPPAPRRWVALAKVDGAWRRSSFRSLWSRAGRSRCSRSQTAGLGRKTPSRRHAPTASGLATFDNGLIQFEYPASWVVQNQLPSTSGLGYTTAILGTLPLDPACGTTNINCYFQEKLKPGTLSIIVGGAAYSGETIFDLPLAPTDRHVTINGLPAIFSDRGHVPTDYYESDLEIGWKIASPTDPSQVVSVEAGIKGPGTDVMRAQVEAMVDSLRFGGSAAATIPPGQEGIDLARTAAIEAMTNQNLQVHSLYGGSFDQDTIYRCIPSERWSSATGSGDATIAVTSDHTVIYGPNGWLGGEEQVHCAGAVEATGGCTGS